MPRSLLATVQPESSLLGVGAAPALSRYMLARKDGTGARCIAWLTRVELATAADLAGGKLGELRSVRLARVGDIAELGGLGILRIDRRGVRGDPGPCAQGQST